MATAKACGYDAYETEPITLQLRGTQNRLVDAIYEATLIPENWSGLLERLADSLGGSSAWLSRMNVTNGTGSGLLARLDPAWTESYKDYFYQLNPFATVNEPDEYVRAWTTAVYVDEQRIDRNRLVQSEYFNDFMRPQGVDGVMIIRLALSDYTAVAVNINRSKEKGGFTKVEQLRAAAYQSHLIRAYAITKRLAAAHASQAELSEAIHDLPHAIIILTAGGIVRRLNGAAESLLRSRSELRVVSSRLTAADPIVAATLEAQIASAGSISRAVRRGHSMSVPGADGTNQLYLSVSPLRTDRSDVFAIEPSVLVCVGDPEARSATSEAQLMQVFGLTRAEAKIAAAVQKGARPNEIAEAMRLSPNTIRVHLARIFEKTGVSRQVDLVRLGWTVGPVQSARWLNHARSLS